MAKPKRERIAKHELIDAAGAVVDDIEKAVAIRYTDVQSGLTTDFRPDMAKPGALWLALFGAKTLATNEASQVRQADGSAQEEIDAISDRFAVMFADQDAKWVDKTRVGGPRYDQPTVATALVNVMIAGGTWQEADRAEKERKAVEAMAADSKKVGTFMSLEGVTAEYKRLRGAKVTSAADVADLLK